MDFSARITAFAKRVRDLLPHLQTEEATKHSLILPFLQLLGYNVFDPYEVVPEFVADVGTKKGEKVDYAIMIGGEPCILVEAKVHSDPLDKHHSQLFRYFSATQAKFAILTNGFVYKFYTDLQSPNRLDLEPFLEVNLLDLRDTSVDALRQFCKESFNPDDILNAATILRYRTQVRNRLETEIENPSDDFVRFWVKDVWQGRVTSSVVEQFRPIIQSVIEQYISDEINARLRTAIENRAVAQDIKSDESSVVPSDVTETEPVEERIVTTQEELEAYYVVKSICCEVVEPSRVVPRDRVSYFSVLLDGNTRKWICRLRFGESGGSLSLPDESKAEVKYSFDKIDDIYRYKDELIAVVRRYTGQ